MNAGKRLVLIGWILVAALTFAMFLAPWTVAPGTVRGLDGRANVMDYTSTWRGLPLFPGIVYAIGDLNCHQKETRSWILHGNQMPMDARMTSGFVASVALVPLVFRLPQRARMRDEFMQFIPRALRDKVASARGRLMALVVAFALSFGPATIDVVAQAATPYESTNLARAVTGALLGGGFALLMAIRVDSLMAPLPAAGRASVTGVGAATSR